LNVVLFKLGWAISNKFNHVLFITLKKGKEKNWLVIASTVSVKRDRTTKITKTILTLLSFTPKKINKNRNITYKNKNKNITWNFTN
jgi:hypothetical protein